MRTLDEDTSWATMRRELRYTIAMLRAAGMHDDVLREMLAALERWHALDRAMTEAEDGVVDANAGVAWADGELDRRVGAFARDLDHAVDGDREAVTFRAFFAQKPSAVMRLALGAELEETAHFATAAAEVELNGRCKKSLAAVLEARVRGAEALAARDKAEAVEAALPIRVRRFKEDVNALRRGVYNALERHAIEHRLGDDYADGFFMAAPSRRKAQPAPRDAAPVSKNTPAKTTPAATPRATPSVPPTA